MDENSIRINGLTADEWEGVANPAPATDEQLQSLGFMDAPQEQPTQPIENEVTQPTDENSNKLYETADKLGIEHPDEGKQYEKLSIGESLKDAAISLGVEASHILAPKSKELQYESRTRLGETMKYGYRYLAGTASLFLGGGWIGAGIKGIGIANKSSKAIKLGSGIQKLFSGSDIIKTGAKASKLQQIGAKSVNAALGGAFSGAIADYTLYRPEDNEGHLADVFEKSDYLSWLQSDENDSVSDAKFKNVLEGFILGAGFGNVIEFGAKPLFGKALKNIKAAVQAQTADEARAALQEVALDEVKIEKFASKADVLQSVKDIKAEADTTGQEASQLILDRMNIKDTSEAQDMLKVLDEGNDIFIHEDGTWDISIEKWDDAYKVSPEEYNKQLAARDKARANDMFNSTPVRMGDTALEHQDAAVKDTWINRSWIGENEELSPKISNKIAKNYKDKWQIDNNIKVEFVDGLTINGQAVEGNTQATKYLGKNKKPKGKLSDITIQIDKNARNPYATLRAELEHARDIAKGEVPDQNVRHFSRYEGLNEGEVASGYVYKKSSGKAQKTANDNIIKEQETPVQEATPQAKIVNETKEILEKPQQLKIDFNTKLNETATSEEAVNKVINGEIKAESVEDIENLINKTIETNPEISGHTWKDVVNDAEGLFKKVESLTGEDISAYKEAFLKNDAALLDEISRKEMAASKVLSILADKLEELGMDAPIQAQRNICDMVVHVSNYVDNIRSGAGRLLNEQKLVNRALNTFGSMRLSQLTKQGIKEFADLLEKDVTEMFNLQFTRGEQLNLAQIKQALFGRICQYGDGEFLELLSNDADFALEFNNVIDNMLKKQGKLDANELYQQIENVVTTRQYKDAYNAAQLAPKPEGKINTIKNWTASQGGIASYYVHNLLSGLGSVAKNIGSGFLNSAYFPARKIVAGFMGGGNVMSKEGWNTYKAMLSNWDESWQLCKEAFLKGEGKLTNVGADTLNMEDGVFKGFHDLSDDNLWHKIQNIHSLMTRAMGATDEFMSQLNYRSICKAKCLTQADKLAELAGKTEDEQWINETADRLFKTKFDSEGKPLDVDAYNEAKTILYQNNLDGKMFDMRTGTDVQMREPTAVMKLAQGINAEANKNAFIKFIFPFVKTGANILQMNLDHNGLYAVLSPAQRKILLSNTPEGALARSQVAFGTFSLAFGTMLAANGLITGSAPPDPKERKALFETGWRPYSVKIGDKYISYQGYEPIHTMLGFSADCFNLGQAITKPEDEQKWTKFSQQVGAALINNFMDKAAFRTGLKQMTLLTNPDDVTDWQKAMSQTMQGFLPMASMVKGISSLGKRETTQPKSAYEMLFNNYFNRGLGDYRRDVFGDRQDIYGLLVTTAGVQGNEPEYQELARLAEYGYSPSEIGTIISDTKLKFRDFKDPSTGRSAYDAMQEELSTLTIGGRTLKEAVRELVTSPEYQMLPDGIDNEIKWSSQDDTKVNALNDIFRDYNDVAKENVMNNNPQFTNNKGLTMQEAKEMLEVKKMDKILNQNLDGSVEKIISLF